MSSPDQSVAREHVDTGLRRKERRRVLTALRNRIRCSGSRADPVAASLGAWMHMLRKVPQSPRSTTFVKDMRVLADRYGLLTGNTRVDVEGKHSVARTLMVYLHAKPEIRDFVHTPSFDGAGRRSSKAARSLQPDLNATATPTERSSKNNSNNTALIKRGVVF